MKFKQQLAYGSAFFFPFSLISWYFTSLRIIHFIVISFMEQWQTSVLQGYSVAASPTSCYLNSSAGDGSASAPLPGTFQLTL